MCTKSRFFCDKIAEVKKYYGNSVAMLNCKKLQALEIFTVAIKTHFHKWWLNGGYVKPKM